MKALLIILSGLLVLANAFFVIAEYALVRSRRSRLEAMAEEGARGARLALAQSEHISDYISACQVGITMASIGIGALGEPAIAHVLEPLLGHAISHAAAVVDRGDRRPICSSRRRRQRSARWFRSCTSIQNPEGVARRIARPLQFFRVVFNPFVSALNVSSRWMLRIARNRS